MYYRVRKCWRKIFFDSFFVNNHYTYWFYLLLYILTFYSSYIGTIKFVPYMFVTSYIWFRFTLLLWKNIKHVGTRVRVTGRLLFNALIVKRFTTFGKMHCRAILANIWWSHNHQHYLDTHTFSSCQTRVFFFSVTQYTADKLGRVAREDILFL